MSFNTKELLEIIPQCLSLIESRLLYKEALLDSIKATPLEEQKYLVLSVIYRIEEKDLPYIDFNKISNESLYGSDSLKPEHFITYLSDTISKINELKQQFNKLTNDIGLDESNVADLVDNIKCLLQECIGFEENTIDVIETGRSLLTNQLPKKEKKKYLGLNYLKLEIHDLVFYRQLDSLFFFASPWLIQREKFLNYNSLESITKLNLKELLSWGIRARERLNNIGNDAQTNDLIDDYIVLFKEKFLIEVPGAVLARKRLTQGEFKEFFELQAKIEERLENLKSEKKYKIKVQIIKEKIETQQKEFCNQEQRKRTTLEQGLFKSLRLLHMKHSYHQELRELPRENLPTIESPPRQVIENASDEVIAQTQVEQLDTPRSNQHSPEPISDDSDSFINLAHQEEMKRAQINDWHKGELSKVHLKWSSALPEKLFQRAESLRKVPKLSANSQKTLAQLHQFKMKSAMPEITFEQIQLLLLGLGGSQQAGKTTGSHRKFHLADLSLPLEEYTSSQKLSVTVVKPHEGNIHLKGLTLRIVCNVLDRIGVFAHMDLLAPKVFFRPLDNHKAESLTYDATEPGSTFRPLNLQ